MSMPAGPAFSAKYDVRDYAESIERAISTAPPGLMVEAGQHTDLEGLIDYLDAMRAAKVRITEVTYSINLWQFGGIIPLKHHSILLRFDGRGFLTLDFGRSGLEWGVFEEFPEFPDQTYYVKSYKVDADPLPLKRYCEETEPFSFFSNDCASWSRGLLKVMRVREASGQAGDLSDRKKGVC